jgi:hypothetical protein
MSQQQFFRNNAELLSRQFLNDPSLAGNVPFPPGFNPNMWMGQGPNMPPQGHPQMMNMGMFTSDMPVFMHRMLVMRMLR